jgi:hypothetical protein
MWRWFSTNLSMRGSLWGICSLGDTRVEPNIKSRWNGKANFRHRRCCARLLGKWCSFLRMWQIPKESIRDGYSSKHMRVEPPWPNMKVQQEHAQHETLAYKFAAIFLTKFEGDSDPTTPPVEPPCPAAQVHAPQRPRQLRTRTYWLLRPRDKLRQTRQSRQTGAAVYIEREGERERDIYIFIYLLIYHPKLQLQCHFLADHRLLKWICNPY